MARKLRKSPPRRAQPGDAPQLPPRRRMTLSTLCVCGLLAAAIAVAFVPALSMPFLHFDDDIYVWGEPHVNKGVSMEGWAWAWTENHAANWHPLTTISHMLDCQIFGLRPWGHHLVNLVLHALA